MTNERKFQSSCNELHIAPGFLPPAFPTGNRLADEMIGLFGEQSTFVAAEDGHGLLVWS